MIRTLATVLVAAAAACGGGGGARKAEPGPAAASPERAGITLAVYKNLAVVRDVRQVEVPRDGGMTWDRVPKLIDATSVTWRSRSDESARVRAQTVVIAASGTEELLAKNLGRRIVVSTADGEVAGTLEAADHARLVVDTGGEKRVLNRHADVQAVSLAGAEGAASGPRLEWGVSSARGGSQLVEVTYQTLGVRWSADYTIVLDEDATRAELAGWATIWNESGASFPSATVQLMPDKIGGKPFMSVGPATLDDRTPVRVALPTGRGLTAARKLVFDSVGEAALWKGAVPRAESDYGFHGRNAVEEHIELAGVAASLPPGNARVYRRRADGSLAWLGQDALGAIEAGKPLRVRLGPAAKLRGTRKQTDFAYEKDRKRIVEEIEVTVQNDGDEARDVVFLERLPRGELWRITFSDAPVEKEDTRTIRATLTVPAKGKTKLSYRVIYDWK